MVICRLYQVPTIEDLSRVVNKAQYFSVVDIKDGFHHAELDESSQKLCVFSTPFGCYFYKRLPFGINVATDIFMERTARTFGPIGIVFVFIDDVLVVGETKEQHDAALDEGIETARKCNIKLNPME